MCQNKIKENPSSTFLEPFASLMAKAFISGYEQYTRPSKVMIAYSDTKKSTKLCNFKANKLNVFEIFSLLFSNFLL